MKILKVFQQYKGAPQYKKVGKCPEVGNRAGNRARKHVL